MNHSTWIVVADASVARTYELPVTGPAKLIEEMDHRAGHLRNADLTSSRPGRGGSDVGGSHSFAAGSEPTELEMDRFARALANHLHQAHVKGTFSSLALVMPPRMLGMVRNHLDKDTTKAIAKEVHHRWLDMPINEIVTKLGVLPERAAIA